MASVENISLEEFRDICAREATENEEIRLDMYAHKLTEIYMKHGVGKNYDRVLQLAMKALKQKKKLQILDNGTDPSDGNIGDDSVIESYKSGVKKSFLLINAPTELNDDISIKEEEAMRTCQFKHFCDVYPDLCDEQNEQVQKEEVTIHTKEQLKDEVKKFMLKSNNTDSSMIVFNGHGGKEGLYIQEGLGVSMELDDFIAIVRDSKKGSFPITMKIIFAQCWGHKHSVSQDDRFISVTSFTSNKAPNTKYIVLDNPAIPFDSEHLQLQEYAEEKAKEEQDKQHMDVETEPGALGGTAAESMDA